MCAFAKIPSGSLNQVQNARGRMQEASRAPQEQNAARGDVLRVDQEEFGVSRATDRSRSVSDKRKRKQRKGADDPDQRHSGMSVSEEQEADHFLRLPERRLLAEGGRREFGGTGRHGRERLFVHLRLYSAKNEKFVV